MLCSYPKIFNLGHAAIRDIFFRGPVLIEEKVDGSQFSFGKLDGVLLCRSKGAAIDMDAPEGMFEEGVEVVKALDADGYLADGYTYRGEYLKKPKHNALAYDRIPEKHIILFDVNTGLESYMNPDEKKAEAQRIGLECVPLVFSGNVEGPEVLYQLLDRVSVLGGQKIEGLVVKQYDVFGRDGKALMGKHVSEAFKEVHSKEWKGANPSGKDVIGLLGEEYRCKARWNKAIQRLRDDGKLEGTPRDIGLIVKEVPDDIKAECHTEICRKLFDWAWPKIRRQVITGLPQYYKEQLLENQFEGTDHERNVALSFPEVQGGSGACADGAGVAQGDAPCVAV